MVKKLALKGLLGVGVCGGAAYTTLQFKDRIDKYAGNLFNKKNLRERAGFNCSDDGLCTISQKARITIRQSGSTDREITGANVSAGTGKIRVYSDAEYSKKYNESFKFVIEEGDIGLGGTGITKLEEFETYELKEEESDGNDPNVKKYVFERKTKASDEIKLALGLPECDLPTDSDATKTCALDETKFKKIKFEGKGSDNITGFPSSNLNLKISKVTDEAYPLGLKFVFESEENITVPGSGGSQIILNKNRGFSVKKSRGPKGVTLSLERAWSIEKILAKVGLSVCSTNGTECTLGKLNIKQGESEVATNKTATPVGGAKIKLYTGDSAKSYSENLKFVVEGGDIDLSDGQGSISKLEELETYEITSHSGTYYLTRKGTKDQAIKSSLGLEDDCSLPTNAGSDTSCSIDLAKLKKINFENKSGNDSSLSLSNSINLKITKVSESDFPLGLKFVFESATDITVPAQEGITITLNKTTDYKIKRKEEGKVSLERAWDVNTLLQKVGLSVCTTDNSECTISNLKVKKGQQSETGKNKDNTTPANAKIVLSTSSAGYKEGLKFSIEGGDITLSGGSGQITKLEEFETYEIEQESANSENYFLTRKTDAKTEIKKALGLPGSGCDLPDKDNEPKTCSLDTAALKAIKFEDKSSNNSSLAVSGASLPLKITKTNDTESFPLGYKFVFESESEISVNTNSGTPLKLSKYIDYKIKKKDKNSLSLEKAWTIEKLIKKVGLTTCVNATADGSECTLGQLNVSQGPDKKETSKSTTGTGKIKLYSDPTYQEGLKFSIEKGDISIENGTSVSKLEEFETYEIKEEQGKYYLTRKTEAKEEIKKALGLPNDNCELPTTVGGDEKCCVLKDADLKKIKFEGVGDSPTVNNFPTPGPLTLKITKVSDKDSFPLGLKFVFDSETGVTVEKSDKTNITLNTNTEFKLKKGDKNTLSLEKAWDLSSLIAKVGLSGCKDANADGTECQIETGKGLSVNQGTDKKATGKKEQDGQPGKIKLYSDSTYKEGLKFSIETGDITLQNGDNNNVSKLEEFETYEIKDDGGTYYLTRKDEAKVVIKKALGLDGIDGCELPTSEGADGAKTCSLDNGKLKALNFKDKNSNPTIGSFPSDNLNLKISRVKDKTDFPLGLKFVFESETDVTVSKEDNSQITLNKYTDYKLKKEEKNALSLEKAWDLSSLIAKVGLKDCTTTDQECKIEETGDSGLNVKQGDNTKSTKKRKDNTQDTQGKIKVFTDNSTGYREGFRFEVVDGDITLQNGNGDVSKLEEMESYEITEDTGTYYLSRKTEAKKAIKKLLGLDGIDSCDLPDSSGDSKCCILKEEILKKIKFEGITGDNPTVENFSSGSLTLTITKTEDKSFPLGLKFVFGSETDVTVKGANGNTSVKLNKNTEFKIKRGSDNKSLSLEKAWNLSSLIAKVGLKDCTSSKQDCEIDDTNGLSVKQGDGKTATGKKKKSGQTGTQGKIKVFTDNATGYKEGFRFEVIGGDIELDGNNGVTKLEEMESYEITEDKGTYYLSRKTEAKTAIKKALGLDGISNCELPTGTDGESTQCCNLTEDQLKNIKFDGKSSTPSVSGFSSEGDQKLKITKTDDTTDFPLGLKFVFEFDNDVTVDKTGNSEKITLNKNTEFKIKRGNDDNNITLEKAWTVETLIKKVGLKDCTSTSPECAIDDNGDGLSVDQGSNKKATKKKKEDSSQGKIKVYGGDKGKGFKEGFKFEIVGGDITLQNGEGDSQVSKLEEFETYEIKEDSGKYYLTRKDEAKEVVKKALGLDQISECELPTGSSGDTTQCCDLTEDYLKKIKFDGITGDPTVTSFPTSGSPKLKITKTDDTKDFPLGLKFVFEFDSGVTVGTTSNGTSFTLNKETEFKIKRGDDNSNITLTKAWNLSTLIGKVGLTTCTDASDSGTECQIDGSDGLKVNQGEGKKSTSKKKTEQSGSQGKIKVYKDDKYSEGFRFVIEEGDITLQNGTDTNVSKLEQFETYEIKNEEDGTYYLTRKTESKDGIKKALGLPDSNCDLPGAVGGDGTCCILSQDDLKKIKFDGKASEPSIGSFPSSLNLKITKTTDTDFPFGYKFVFDTDSDVTVSKNGGSGENITLNKNTEFKIKKSDNSNDISLTKAWTVESLTKKVGLSGCTNANTEGTECTIEDGGSGLSIKQGNNKSTTKKKKSEQSGGTQGKIKVYQDKETENNKKYSEGFKFVIEEGDIILEEGESISKLEQFETYEIKEDGGKYYLTKKTDSKEGIKKALGLDGISNCDLPDTVGKEEQCCNLTQDDLKKIKFDGKSTSDENITGFSGTPKLKITKTTDTDFPFGYKFVFDTESDITINTTDSGSSITLNSNTEFKIKKGSEKNNITLTKAWTVESLAKKVGLKDCNSADANGTDCTIDSSGLSVSQGGSKKATGKKKQEDSGSNGKIKVYGGDKGKGFKEGLKFEVVGGDITFQNGDSSGVTKLEQFETYEIKEESNTYYLTRKDEAKEGIKKALGLPDSGCDLPTSVGGEGTCCIVSETDLKKIKFDGVTGESPNVENFTDNLKLKITKTDDTTTYPFGYKFVFESEGDIKISKESESDSVILQKNISYKIKKTADSNTISLEKLEVSKLLEKVGLTGCDNITNGKGTECSIKTDSDSGLNVKQDQKKEEKKKQKTGQSSSQGKIKVYGGDEAKGYGERLKFVIEGGDIEIEGSQVTKLEQFETYEIKEEQGTYYLTRKTEAKEGIKKALGLDAIDSCDLPDSSDSDSTCSNIDEDKLKKIKFDGMSNSPTVTGLSSSPTTTNLKISKVTDTTTYPFGYKFVFESDKDITINKQSGNGDNIILQKNISYKIKKTTDSNTISLEKLEVSKLLEKVGLKECDSVTSETGVECKIKDDNGNGLNVKQEENKEEKKKKKTEGSSNGKIKVYTGEGAKGYSERLKFVIEEGDIEIEGGTSITKLEEFETYEIKEEEGKYYLTRKDKASSIKKKLLGLPDSCNLPESGKEECCVLEDDDIKKIKFDGLNEGEQASITNGADGETALSLKISISPTGETNKDDFPLGYKFVLESNKEITLGSSESNKKIAKNTNTEFKIKKSGTGKETKLSLEKAWTVETLGKKVGLKCPANATEETTEKECTLTDNQINVHNGEENTKIENGKVKEGDTSSKKIKYEEDQEGYNQGFKFYVDDEDIPLSCNGDSEESQPEKKIHKKNGEDGNSPVYYEIKEEGGKWYLYKKSDSSSEG